MINFQYIFITSTILPQQQCDWPSVKTVFGVPFLGYCRNMSDFVEEDQLPL